MLAGRGRHQIFDRADRSTGEERTRRSDHTLPPELERIFGAHGFHMLCDHATDLFWVLEFPVNKLLYVSRSFEAFTGIPVEEVSQNPAVWQDLIHPEDRDTADAAFEAYLKSEGEFDVEYRIVLGDSVRWIHDRAVHREDVNGRSIILGLARDITMEKVDQTQLLEHEQLFNLITENTSDFIILLQGNRLVYYNKAFKDAAGGEITADVASNFLASVVPEHRDRINEYYQRRLKGLSAPEKYETQLNTLDGRRITVEVRSKTVTHGGSPAVLAVIRDVTERSRLEQEHMLAQQVVDSIPSGLFIYRFEQPDKLILLSANPQAERITGITAKRWVGHEFDEIWPNARELGITEQYLTAARERRMVEVQEQAYSDNRLAGHFHIRVFPLPLNRIAVAFEDVTKRVRAVEALQKSEERLSLFMNAAMDAFTIWDEDLKLVDLNKAAETYFAPNQSREVLIGTAQDQLFGEQLSPIFRRVLETGKHISLQNTIKLRDGRRTIFDINAFKVGKGVGMIASDVTERVAADEAVLRSERWFRGLLQGITDAVYVHRVNRDGTIGPFLEVNQVACDMLGYTREQLVGMSIYDVDDPDEGHSPAGVIKMLLEGKPVVFEQVHRTHDGERIPVEISASMLHMDDGDVVISIVRDTRNRKRAEAETKMLALALDQSAEAIIITDPQGRIEYVNQAFLDRSGYSRSETLGKTPVLLKSGVHDDSFYNQMWETLENGETWEGNVTNKSKEGMLYHEFCVISPVRDENGEIINYISVQRDITRERSLEQQLQQAQKMETVGSLTSGIAHDFNNLLTVITGNIDLLLLSQGDHEFRGDLEEISHVADRASQLTRQLLAFSRKQTAKPGNININQVLEQSERMLRRALGEHITLRTEIDETLWSIHMDPVQLEQILVNLAVNARDAMPDGGTLYILTRNVPHDRLATGEAAEFGRDHVLLEVKDDGAGMNPDTAAHIFEPFYTTKSAGKGTGLGLSTVSNITKQYGGTIHVDSAPGEGAVFRLRFPRTKPAQAKQIPENSVQDELHGSETLMLVEDDALVRRSTARSLQRFGYAVLEAEDAEHALQMLATGEKAPDLILTDIVMPNMNGAEFVRKLREQNHPAKLIFMSGYTTEMEDARDLIEMGIPFIQKPFRPSSLARLIRDVFNDKPE